MRYYKSVIDNIVSVSTLDADGNGNITEQEYNTIRNLLLNAPAGKVVVEDGNGYAYADAPSTDELEDAEALAIILGGDSE
jgi:hypothetical protein